MKQITDDEILTITTILNVIKARGDFPVTPNTTPTITVTAPIGGETWKRGTTNHLITWTSTNVIGQIRISLFKGTVEVGVIVASAANSGVYSWSIGTAASLKTGPDFRVRVQSITAPLVYGISPDYFTLQPADPIDPIPDPIPSGEYGAGVNNTGSPIGGGAGYKNIITEGNYTVTTLNQFLTALTDAKSGDIIFIPSGTTIDLSGQYGLSCNAGVTIAGDRGIGVGGVLYRPRVYTPDGGGRGFTFNIYNPNVRFTGLRIRGGDSQQDLCVDVEDGNCSGKVAQWPQAVYSGITFRNTGGQVDNCEMWDWSWRAVGFMGGRQGHVHHCYIHHCHARGYGYGVGVHEGGQFLAEANLFDYTRHALTSSGGTNDDYEARYNIHLGHGNAFGGHHFDVHSPGGGTTYIHHNTFKPSALEAIGIRACPQGKCTITKNVFEKSFNGTVGFEKCSPLVNISMTDNMVDGIVRAGTALWHA